MLIVRCILCFVTINIKQKKYSINSSINLEKTKVVPFKNIYCSLPLQDSNSQLLYWKT